MSYSNNFTFNTAKLTGSLKSFTKKGKTAIDAEMAKQAQEVTKYMKSNAPWKDRTGVARDSLKATYTVGAVKSSMTLSNPVEYGIYLEKGMEKRFAIIDPTIKVMGPKVMQSLSGVFKKA